MRVQLQLTDDLYDTYAGHAQALAPRAVSAEEMMIQCLSNFSSIPPQVRVLILAGAAREQVEKTLGGGYLTSGEDLVSKIKELAALEVGKVEIDFTPAQWHQLKVYSAKNGITVEEAAKRVVRQMATRWFDYCGG
jgi:hypothetical protein